VDHPGIRGLNLILTAQCNLRCRYCYQNAKGPRRMDREVLRASVDLAVSSPRERVDLVFVGGEPLLEFAALRGAVERAGARRPPGMRVGFRISTNGTLLTEEVAEFLARHRVYTQLSFDGVRGAQDVRCPGTFDVLDRLLDSLRERHPRFYRSSLIVSITLVPSTVRHLADSVDYFFEKGVAKIGITPSITPYAEWRREDIELLDGQFARIFESSVEHLERTGEVPLALFRERDGKSRGPGERVGASADDIALSPSAGAPSRDVGSAKTRMMCRIADNATPTVDVDGQVYGCGLYAPSVNQLRSPLHLGCLATMRLGDVRKPGFDERYRRFREAAGRLPVYAEKERKRSAYGRCADCAHFDLCTVCPVSLGHVEGNADPDRVPDFACAYNFVSLEHRERFPRRPSMRERVLGEPYREEMAWWSGIAGAVREARAGARREASGQTAIPPGDESARQTGAR